MAQTSRSIRRCCQAEIPQRRAARGQGFTPVLAPDPTSGYGSTADLPVLQEQDLHVHSTLPCRAVLPIPPSRHRKRGWCSGYLIYYLVAAKGSLTPSSPWSCCLFFSTTLLPSQGHPHSPRVPAPALEHPPRTYSAGFCVPSCGTQTSSWPLTQREQTLTCNQKKHSSSKGEISTFSYSAPHLQEMPLPKSPADIKGRCYISWLRNWFFWWLWFLSESHVNAGLLMPGALVTVGSSLTAARDHT